MKTYFLYNGWFYSINHKIIGVLYLLFGIWVSFLAIFMFVLICYKLGAHRDQLFLGDYKLHNGMVGIPYVMHVLLMLLLEVIFLVIGILGNYSRLLFILFFNLILLISVWFRDIIENGIMVYHNCVFLENNIIYEDVLKYKAIYKANNVCKNAPTASFKKFYTTSTKYTDKYKNVLHTYNYMYDEFPKIIYKLYKTDSSFLTLLKKKEQEVLKFNKDLEIHYHNVYRTRIFYTISSLFGNIPAYPNIGTVMAGIVDPTRFLEKLTQEELDNIPNAVLEYLEFIVHVGIFGVVNIRDTYRDSLHKINHSITDKVVAQINSKYVHDRVLLYLIIAFLQYSNIFNNTEEVIIKHVQSLVLKILNIQVFCGLEHQASMEKVDFFSFNVCTVFNAVYSSFPLFRSNLGIKEYLKILYFNITDYYKVIVHKEYLYFDNIYTFKMHINSTFLQKNMDTNIYLISEKFFNRFVNMLYDQSLKCLDKYFLNMLNEYYDLYKQIKSNSKGFVGSRIGLDKLEYVISLRKEGQDNISKLAEKEQLQIDVCKLLCLRRVELLNNIISYVNSEKVNIFDTNVGIRNKEIIVFKSFINCVCNTEDKLPAVLESIHNTREVYIESMYELIFQYIESIKCVYIERPILSHRPIRIYNEFLKKHNSRLDRLQGYRC